MERAKSFNRLRDQIIHTLIHGIAPLSTVLSKTKHFPYTLQDLDEMPSGTLGKETAVTLKEHQFQLIPSYEMHDFKHVLLNYPMTGIGEIRMQFFALGNGNHFLTTWGIIAIGLALFPHKIRLFLQEYRRGKSSQNITHWQFEQLVQHNIIYLRSMLNGK